MHDKYWAFALEPGSSNYWAHTPQLLRLHTLEPVLHNKWETRILQLENSPHLLQLEKKPIQQQIQYNQK